MTRRGLAVAAAMLPLAFAIACAPKTKYVSPAVEEAPAFKENANWKTAQPADQAIRGNWWEIFGDPRLNDLEQQVSVSNQTLKAAEAQFEQARQAIHVNRAALAPQVVVNPSITRNEQSQNRATPAPHESYADFFLPADVTYEVDVWGRVRGTVAVAERGAQASAADLQSVNLSVHAELASDYFALRSLDEEKQLLDTTVTAYERALELTENRFRGGIASQQDVAQAETQLETTRAQAVDIEVFRAEFEHAIAVLLGRAASAFSLAAAPLGVQPPPIPVGLPGDLLQRRPDIASAERRVAAANAQVGVTETAFYPVLTLTGVGGFESDSLASWISRLSNFWSVGGAAFETVFDYGRRRAITAQARAAYDQDVAFYEQTVLVAFQEVEDNLAALRILDEESQVQANAVAAAERSLTLATNRYRGGVATYLEVIAAQSAALANERAAVNLLARRLNASVQLIKALGGGWDASALRTVLANPDQH